MPANVWRIGAVLTLVSALGTVSPRAHADLAQRQVPLIAPITIFHEAVTVPIGPSPTPSGKPQQLTIAANAPVGVVPADPTSGAVASYYLFPSFVLSRAEMRYIPGEFIPLIDATRRVSAPPTTDSEMEIQLTLTDLMRDPLIGPAIQSALANEGALKGGTPFQADVHETWSASLKYKGIEVATATFRYANVNQSQAFALFSIEPYTDDSHNVRNPLYDMLAGSVDPITGKRVLDSRGEARFLSLDLTARYPVEIYTLQISINATFVDEAQSKLLSKLTSTGNPTDATGQPADLVAVIKNAGGSIFHSLDLEDDLRQEIALHITLGDLPHGGDVSQLDQNLMNKFIDETFKLFTDARDLSGKEYHNKVVSFLLDNGLRVTTPIAEVDHIQQFVMSHTVEQTKTFLNEVSKSSESMDLAASASVFGVGWGGNGSFSDKWQKATDDEKTMAAEQFRESLNAIAQELNGKFGVVQTMNIQDVNNYIQHGYFAAKYIVDKLEIGEAPFDWPLQFDGTDLPGQPAVSSQFVDNLFALIEASRSDFRGHATVAIPNEPGVSSTDLVLIGDTVRVQGMSFDRRVRLADPFAKTTALWWSYTQQSKDSTTITNVFSQLTLWMEDALHTLESERQTQGTWMIERPQIIENSLVWAALEGSQGPWIEVTLDRTPNGSVSSVAVFVHPPSDDHRPQCSN